MRICDWIAGALYDFGVKRVHGLMGGGAAGLNDGFILNEKIEYICYHHEQSAGHAAIGESKLTGKISVVNPTTGCGGLNCITSVVNAWQDSVPVLFVSGNVPKATCTHYLNKKNNTKLRTYGIQEHDIVNTVKDITKFSHFVSEPSEIFDVFQAAIDEMLSGRRGPAWIDIPSDIQQSQISSNYSLILPQTQIVNQDSHLFVILEKLENASRPLILAGGGIRQSASVTEFEEFVTRYRVPFVTTYACRDLMSHSSEFNIGTVGIKGSRAGNFALQNCDFLLILGSRLASSVVGYDPALFSPFSEKIMIDCDEDELNKNIIPIETKITTDLKSALGGLIAA